MDQSWRLFGSLHLSVLAALGLLTAVVAWSSRHYPGARRPIRLGLGLTLAVSELVWYGYAVIHGMARFPDGLPLELCDATLWLTVAALLSRHAWTYEIVYFWGLAGTSMALLTPNLETAELSYGVVQFFIAHGIVVAGLLYLTIGESRHPKPGAWLRAFAWLNGYAAAIALFNALFKTNYLFLCRKPEAASILNFFGPWPVYILAEEALALALFALLQWPFRRPSSW